MEEELLEIMRPYIESGEYDRDELENIFQKEYQKVQHKAKVEYQEEYNKIYKQELEKLNPLERFGVQLSNVFEKNVEIGLPVAFKSTQVYLGDLINKVDPTGGKVMDFIASGGDVNELADDNDIGDVYDDFLIEKQNELYNLREKSSNLYTGEGVIGGFRDGDVVDIASGVGNAVVSTLTTVVPAYFTRGASLPAQIIAPMYTEFNAEKAKSLYPDDDFETQMRKLYENGEDNMTIPTVLGVGATALEYVGVKGITNSIMNRARTAGAKRFVQYLRTGNREGATEFFQYGIENLNKSLAQGNDYQTAVEESVKSLWSMDAAESFVQGFIGGTTVSGIGRETNLAFRDDNDNIRINEYINNIGDLQQEKLKAHTPETKSFIDEEIKKQEKEFKDYVKSVRKKSTYITEQEGNDIIQAYENKKSYVSQIEGLKSQLDKKIITEKQYSYATQRLNENIKLENEKVNFIKNEANKKMLNDDVRTFVEPLSRTNGLKINVVSQESDFLTQVNQRLEALGKKQYTAEQLQNVDGLILGKDVLINETVAARNNAVTVGSHEVLHAIVRSSLRSGTARTVTDKITGGTVETTLTKEGEQILRDFKDSLTDKELSVVQERIDNNYRYNEDGSEKAFVEYAEEYITAYGDAQLKGNLQDGIITKLKNFFQRLINGKNTGYKNLNFKTGDDVRNFLKEYVSDRKKGKLRNQFVDMIDVGLAEPGEVQLSKTRDLTDAQKQDLVNKYGKEFTDSQKTGGDTINFEDLGGNAYWQVYGKDVAEVIQKQGLLDGLILAKPHEGIDDKTFLDTTYAELLPHIKNYKPERKNPDGLFGWINPQIGNKAKQAFNSLTEGQITAPTVEVGQTTKEGDIKVQVAAEKDSALEDFENMNMSLEAQRKREADKNKKQKVRKSKLRQSLGIKDDSDVYNKVKDSVRQSLIMAYQKTRGIDNKEQRATKIIEILSNEYAGEKGFTSGRYTELFKIVKDTLGTDKVYFKTLRENKEAILETVFTSDLVKLERKVADNEKVFVEFKQKLTSKKQVEDAVRDNLLPKDELKKIDKGQSVNLYVKKETTPEQFISFFDQPLKIQRTNEKTGETFEVRSGLKGTRKDGISKYISKGLVFDALLEVRQEPEVKKLLTEEFEAELDIVDLSSKINRDIDVQFSKSYYNSQLQLTELQYRKKPLAALQGKIQEIEKRIQNNEDVEESELYMYNNGILQEMQAAFENNLPPKVVYDIIIRKLPPTRESLTADFSSLENFVRFIKNTTMPQVRKIGFEVSKKYLQQLTENTNDAEKVRIINEYLKNIGRSTRSGMIDGLTTNRIFIERVLKPLFGDKFVNENYQLQEVKDGEIIVYNQDGNFVPVPMYENIENIKNNVRDNQDLANLVNEQANDARTYLQNILDSNLSTAEKLAIVDLMSLDQRGTIRKMYKLGVKINKDSNLTSKDLVLEHEITVSDMVNQIQNTIKGKSSQAELNQYIESAYVHVLPKEIDVILNKAGLKFKGGRTRYTYNADVVNFFAEQYEKGVIESLPENLFTAFNNQNLEEAHLFSKSVNNPNKGITILDFDDTLATTKSLVRYTKPDGTTGTLTPEQYASTYESLLGLGYKFDFSEFNKVVDGKPAPLLNKAKKLAGKFGTKDMFILTARPQASAPAIKRFLKENGLDIPLKNITGLGNSTADAKASWVLNKAKEGYNDFYFADDAIQNVEAVQNMLNQFDVKSKVQQARVDFSKSKMSNYFNAILRDVSGVDRLKIFSAAEAAKKGETKGQFRFFIPPNHEDFRGLLYNFMGKGERGNRHMRFFETTLLKPLNEAYRRLNNHRQSISVNYKALRKRMPDTVSILNKNLPNSSFTFEDAVRVYLFNKAGFKIPGLDNNQQVALINVVNSQASLKQYADMIGKISTVKQGYVKPTENWQVGSIRLDLLDATNRVGRKKFFNEFIENSNIIFSRDNLNKIEAIYGRDFRLALEDVLEATITGNNRPISQNKAVNRWLDWVNGSVAATMFFNARSAILQQLSFVNFLNFGDNNIFKASARFADQGQFWSDFSKLFNSNFLKQRRSGAAFDVNANEIATEVAKPKTMSGKVRAALKHLLDLGFLPTQLGDSFAIAIGGASFYRNRVNSYIKDGLSQKEAESKAFLDFQTIAEETQQSARPDMVSQLQRSILGRWIFAFQNVTSQYARIVKKSYLDLTNRRISKGYKDQGASDTANISRIIYYGAVQSIIFYGLQQALFAMMFEDDDEEDKKNERFFKTKKDRVLYGTLDSLLRGSGLPGAVLSTLMNYTRKRVENAKSDSWFKTPAWPELLQIAPPIGIKVRKLTSSENTEKWNKDVMKYMSKWDIDNPLWDAVSSGVEGLTNLPVNRLYRKVQNLKAAFDSENAWWQRVAVGLGWSRWDVGIENKDVEKAKQIVKSPKFKNSDEIKENIKLREEDGICAAISRSGNRCRNKALSGNNFCTIHDEVEQSESGEQKQCKGRRTNGQRCKMMTTSKSGYCYYHD